MTENQLLTLWYLLKIYIFFNRTFNGIWFQWPNCYKKPLTIMTLPHRKGGNIYVLVMAQISVSKYQKVNFLMCLNLSIVRAENPVTSMGTQNQWTLTETNSASINTLDYTVSFKIKSCISSSYRDFKENTETLNQVQWGLAGGTTATWNIFEHSYLNCWLLLDTKWQGFKLLFYQLLLSTEGKAASYH